MNNVNHPDHYNQGKIEVIDIIEDLVRDYPGVEAFCIGNAIKYIARAPYKGSKQDDIRKAIWYLNKELDILDYLDYGFVEKKEENK